MQVLRAPEGRERVGGKPVEYRAQRNIPSRRVLAPIHGTIGRPHGRCMAALLIRRAHGRMARRRQHEGWLAGHAASIEATQQSAPEKNHLSIRIKKKREKKTLSGRPEGGGGGRTL